MSEVVTGDAVVLDVQVAQLPVRAVGALIDIAVILIGYLLALMLWAATLSQFDDAVTAAIMIIFTVLLFIGYPLVFEWCRTTAARSASGRPCFGHWRQSSRSGCCWAAPR